MITLIKLLVKGDFPTSDSTTCSHLYSWPPKFNKYSYHLCNPLLVLQYSTLGHIPDGISFGKTQLT